MLQNTQTQIKNNMQDLVNNANHSSALVASPAVQIKGSDGRYKTLKEYLDNNPIKEDECYIFVGDYLDRGLQNAETIQLLLQLFKKPNFKFFLELK